MYEEFYGFSARPFQLAPDPDFYFESTTHRKALSYLGYGLAQGEGFIVITGEVGAGKSTLAAHLMATIDRDRLTVGQIVTSALSGDELVHVAARAFGMDVAGHDKASALGALEEFLGDEARAGRRCLLVVDEAQSLSFAALEELRMFSNFQLGAHPLLQVLLLGQPEFRDHLRQSPDLEQLRQRVIANHHLTAMEPAEVGAYIEHRLRHVGWHGENPAFGQRVYAEMAKTTRGIPRKINQLANRLLLMGAIEQRQRIDSAMLSAVLADMAEEAPRPAAEATPAEQAPVAATIPAAARAESVAAPAVPAATVAEQIASPAFDPAGFEALLTSRDEQIAELQQAVIEIAEMKGAETAPDRPSDEELLDALGEAAKRISGLETRVTEQEQLLRHTLSMLIEWFEGEDAHRAAA
ncbi:MAG: XrtA-associated ATPase [Sphingomonadales bacterium]|nr:XrtA-associated ATPase [Sphingomonadales bacterium]MDE2570071.1 XrtA-associated ATPase [Sphingomonadales bacterium]